MILSDVHDGATGTSTTLTYVDDEDEAPRKRRLVVEHGLATPLEAVGEQVWRGSLVLCDWLLEERHAVRGSTVLEVGAGVGVPGILSAKLGAQAVTLTDALPTALRDRKSVV